MAKRLPWLIEVLIRLHPSSFRSRYEGALRETLAVRLAEGAGRGAVWRARFWLREAAGLAGSAWRERRAVRTGFEAREAMVREVGMAARRLWRTPGFTLSAVGMLALGMGATAAVYTLLHRVILRPLPYAGADRLVWLDHRAPGFGTEVPVGITSWLYVRYGEASRLLDGVALAQPWGTTVVEGDGPPERVNTAAVTPSIARVLGVAPALGRWFTEADGRSVVLSDGIWRRRFGADPGVLGRIVRLGDTDFEVVGVMPPHFGAFPDASVEMWWGREYTIDHPDGGFNYVAVGRMRDGVRLDALRSELQSLVETAPAEYGDHRGIARRVEEGRVQAAPVSLQDHMTGKVRATLWMLLGAVALVLLTAWANVANLFLVRTDARRREVAVRRALGAGRGAIARFHFAEGGILALAGWLFGLALAWVAIRSIIGLSSLDLPRADEITIDANVLIVSFILAVLAGAGLTAIPLWGGERAAAGALGDGGRGSTASRARLRFRSFLMAGQVALALMLLAGSGLLVRSYLRVRDASPGFTARNVLFFDVGLTASGYGTKAAAAQFHDRLADRIGALPGVERVGIATCLPFDGYCWGEGITIDGESRSEENSPNVSMRRVSPGFFETLQLPMVAGRAFTAEDARARADVVVLSEATARRFFGNADPIGRRVTIGDGGLQWYTIVGVATDAASHSVMEAARELVFYLPIRDSRDDPRTVSIHGMRFLVRTSGAPEELAPAVRAIVGELDPGLALDRVRTLDSILAADRAPVAFTAGLLLIAGGVALLLGALGIHAVVSYVVGRRTAEIGLRLALGARAGHVLGMVFRQAGAATLAGVVIGLAGAALLTRLLTSQLFGVEPLDPAVFAAATGLLLVAAFSAAAIPALRASRLRPLDALRVE